MEEQRSREWKSRESKMQHMQRKICSNRKRGRKKQKRRSFLSTL